MKNNSTFSDVIIIGGGASGLFCASLIKKHSPHLSVTILEKQKTVGKKLLATGNGRCNLTNTNVSPDYYHGSFKSCCAEIIKDFTPADLISHLKSLGMLTTTDTEGRVYPLSRHSATMLDTLMLDCENSGVNIICDSFVNNIESKNNTYTVTTDNETYKCNKLVVATGSKATPETGADDSIFKVINRMGIKTTHLSPALCPVYVKSKTLFALKGVRACGKVSLIHNNKIIKTEDGEIQFTDKTLSGICIFNLSRLANTMDKSYISVSLLPFMDSTEIVELLCKAKQRLSPDTSAENILTGVFQRKLSAAILKEVGINKDRTIATISRKEINELAQLINDWRFEVIPSSDFKRAQVVAGGIDGAEINPTTMECKKHKNLYIIGEAIDIDGDCGGFNLHFAFASAYCAAKSITI